MNQRLKLLLVFSLLTPATFLHAGLVTFSDQGTFDEQGAIVYNTAFACVDVCYEANPWTVGGVTYSTGHNVIVGWDRYYGNPVPVFLNSYWTPLPASIETSPTRDMLGFLLGSLGGTSPMDLTIYTNLSSYSFLYQAVPNVATGLQFFGFVGTGGEYLTGFNLASVDGPSMPAIANVQIGNSGGVAAPEPASLLLLASAGLFGGFLRRRPRR